VRRQTTRAASCLQPQAPACSPTLLLLLLLSGLFRCCQPHKGLLEQSLYLGVVHSSEARLLRQHPKVLQEAVRAGWQALHLLLLLVVVVVDLQPLTSGQGGGAC
jgi:hypothetical protein